MENIFAVVEEFQKKLNRPIKDLDDIRIAMAALKEIREQQISTDFQVGPIEVDGQLFCYRNISTPWILSAGVLTGSVFEWQIDIKANSSNFNTKVALRGEPKFMFLEKWFMNELFWGKGSSGSRKK